MQSSYPFHLSLKFSYEYVKWYMSNCEIYLTVTISKQKNDCCAVKAPIHCQALLQASLQALCQAT